MTDIIPHSSPCVSEAPKMLKVRLRQFYHNVVIGSKGYLRSVVDDLTGVSGNLSVAVDMEKIHTIACCHIYWLVLSESNPMYVQEFSVYLGRLVTRQALPVNGADILYIVYLILIHSSGECSSSDSDSMPENVRNMYC